MLLSNTYSAVTRTRAKEHAPFATSHRARRRHARVRNLQRPTKHAACVVPRVPRQARQGDLACAQPSQCDPVTSSLVLAAHVRVSPHVSRVGHMLLARVHPEGGHGHRAPCPVAGGSCRPPPTHTNPPHAHLVHRPKVLVVLPAADLHPVHEQELPRQQAAHVDVLEGLRQVLRQAGLVEEDFWLHNLLHQHAGNAQHGPAGVDQLRLAVPAARTDARGAAGSGWMRARVVVSAGGERRGGAWSEGRAADAKMAWRRRCLSTACAVHAARTKAARVRARPWGRGLCARRSEHIHIHAGCPDRPRHTTFLQRTRSASRVIAARSDTPWPLLYVCTCMCTNRTCCTQAALPLRHAPLPPGDLQTRCMLLLGHKSLPLVLCSAACYAACR